MRHYKYSVLVKPTKRELLDEASGRDRRYRPVLLKAWRHSLPEENKVIRLKARVAHMTTWQKCMDKVFNRQLA
jgi:hypothetical protein